jgi:hypothetical protein
MGDQRFIIEGPSRIRLSAEARADAKLVGWSDEKMAHHLLNGGAT